MITRRELKQLQALTQVPALSILLPTHRTSPDNKQDPIRVKNLVMDDAVDEIIEAVLAKGGNVAIVDDGLLSVHQQIALTLRY